LIERYVAEITVEKRGSNPETYRLRRFLGHPICKRRVKELSERDFAIYRDQRLKQVSPSSVKRELATVHNCFEVARTEWGVAARVNPLSGLRLPVPNDQRDRRLQPGELDRLLSAAATTRTKHLSEIILFAIETGMRRGEIVSIKWRDVDLQRRSVRLTQTKNGHPRTIPLSKAAIALLTVQNGSCDDSESRVFAITGNALRLAWERVKTKAGIEDLRFHDLRHEAISRFFGKGLSVPEVSRLGPRAFLASMSSKSDRQGPILGRGWVERS
jgi:integrase